MLQLIHEPAAVSVYDRDGRPVGRVEPVWPDLWRAVALCGVREGQDAYAWCWEAYLPRELAMIRLLEHLRECRWSGGGSAGSRPASSLGPARRLQWAP